MKKIQFLIPAFAFAALAFVGCSDDDTTTDANANGTQTAATKLALADEAQAELTFAASEPEAQIVILDTDAEAVTVKQVLAEDETEVEWCEVSVLSATEIKVAPASNFDAEARSIKYRVSAGELAPVEFTVTQEGVGEEPAPVQNTLSIDLPGEWGYSFTAPAAGGQITVATVTTDAEVWTAKLSSIYGSFDEDEDDEELFCKLQTVSGVSGDALIVVFEANTTSDLLSGAVVTISAGNAEPITIYLNQDAPEATEIMVADAEWEEELENPYAVLFGKDEFSSAKKKEFGVEANGSYKVKIVAEGTDTEVEEEDAWIEAFGGYGAVTITALSANDTEVDRKLDVILVGQNNAELFRFKVTQSGVAETEEEVEE